MYRIIPACHLDPDWDIQAPEIVTDVPFGDCPSPFDIFWMSVFTVIKAKGLENQGTVHCKIFRSTNVCRCLRDHLSLKFRLTESSAWCWLAQFGISDYLLGRVSWWSHSFSVHASRLEKNGEYNYYSCKKIQYSIGVGCLFFMEWLVS